MKPRNTFYLVLLAAGLFAFIYFFERHRNFALPPPAKLVPGFTAAAVTNIQIQGRNLEEIRGELTTNGAWQLTRPIVYPAQTAAIENLLTAIQNLVAQNHISAQELKDKRDIDAEYGFDNARVTIEAIQQGNEHTLKIGNVTAPGDQMYAKVVGSDGVDIISKDLLQFIPSQPADWRDTAFLNLQGRVFDRITVTNGAKTFGIQSDGTNSSWHLLPHDRINIVDLKVLFDQLQWLQVVQFVKDPPIADLEPYGLQPPELELDFDHGTNHLLTLQFGKSPTNHPDLIYARRDDQGSVVLVEGARVAGWRVDKAELRDRTLAGMYTWLPDEISVGGRASFTVRRMTNDSWRVTAPSDFPADTNLMRQFITKLARLSVVPTNGPVAVKDIVPPSEWTNYGLASPSWKYVLKENVTNGSSVTTNAFMAEIDFGAISNNEIIFARRPEEPSVYSVALADFQQLPASGYRLRERRIWDFPEQQVVRIVIRQDGKPLELLHKALNEWSPGPGSEGIINPLAVEVGAQELGVLAAEDFVERGDEKKADYGFTENSLQITAFVTNAGKVWKYDVEFGGWSPRGLRYGMVELDGQKWIFEFPAVVHERLMSYFSIHDNVVDAHPKSATGVSTTNAPPR